MSPIGSFPGREDDFLRQEAAMRLSLSIVNSYPPRKQNILSPDDGHNISGLLKCTHSIYKLVEGLQLRMTYGMSSLVDDKCRNSRPKL
jgi:hypothetical protein